MLKSSSAVQEVEETRTAGRSDRRWGDGRWIGEMEDGGGARRSVKVVEVVVVVLGTREVMDFGRRGWRRLKSWRKRVETRSGDERTFTRLKSTMCLHREHLLGRKV